MRAIHSPTAAEICCRKTILEGSGQQKIVLGRHLVDLELRDALTYELEDLLVD